VSRPRVSSVKSVSPRKRSTRGTRGK
jgi:hypothetical protein